MIILLLLLLLLCRKQSIFAFQKGKNTNYVTEVAFVQENK